MGNLFSRGVASLCLLMVRTIRQVGSLLRGLLQRIWTGWRSSRNGWKKRNLTSQDFRPQGLVYLGIRPQLELFSQACSCFRIYVIYILYSITNSLFYVFPTAYIASPVSGTGTITGWTEVLDVGVGTNVAGGFVGGTGIHTIVTAGVYFYHGSFRCQQGSACDVTFRMTGTRVAAFVRLNSNLKVTFR